MKRLLLILLCGLGLTAGATTYYVSSSDGSDSDSGLTQALAKATLSWVNGVTFSAGDSILFKCGDTFRGSIYQNEDGNASAYIVYGSYGTGARPKILGAKDLSATGDWEVHSGNVWKTTATLGTAQNDISNLIFNNEESCGFKKKSIDSLNAQGKFWYNSTDDLVYIYSTSNPGTFYTHIEAAGHHDINQGLLKWINSSYIKIENLDIRYSSAAGIETEASDHIIIEDYDVSWIGGEWLFTTGSDLRRLGNGLSFALTNDNIIARNGTVSECFDAGISPQAWVDASSMTNMWFYNNIITNCWYSYETWSASTYTLSNVHFFNNTCVDAGEGWSNSVNQRPDLNNASHVIMWALTGTATNVTIRNNIFLGGTNYALRLDDNVNKLTVDYNVFDVDTVGYTAESTKYVTLAAWVAAMSQDAHSIDGNPLFNSPIDFSLQATSPCIDAGVDTDITTDFDGNVRPYNVLYDIGAYEYASYEVTSGTVLGTGTGNNLMVDKNGRIIIIQ
jgi:hypothetical protein